MKHVRYIPLLLASAVLFLAGCSEDPSIGDPTNGFIQAESYVAIGNSVTAGVQSGAMYADAQKYSYPNLIAQQIGASFTQPLMPGDGSGERVKLTSLNPVKLEQGAFKVALPSNLNHPLPYNNLGVPLALSYDLLDETPFSERMNPVFQLILRNSENFGASVMAQAVALQPKLVTFWIGNNDVLNYASSGGTTGTNATQDGPTDKVVFETLLTNAIDYLKQRLPAAKVVMANIPDITSIPYFTTVPPMLLVQGQVVSIWVEDSQTGVRKATPADMILLPAQGWLSIGHGMSEDKALPNSMVLDPQEQSIIAQAVADYNASIAKIATQNEYVVADMNALYDTILKNGYSVAGETFTTSFISGGLFSLDGIHPSSKGAGVIANEFIRTMNAHYGSNIRYVDISAIPGIPVGAAAAGTIAWSPDWRLPGAFNVAPWVVQR